MESGKTSIGKRIASAFKRFFRRIALLKVNRELFVFLIFLIVAIVFWFSQSFKDHTTVSLEYSLELINVPKSTIFTSDVPKTVTVAVSGRGFSILEYVSKKQHKHLQIDYSDLPKIGGMVTIDNYVWKKVLNKEFPSGVTYSSVTPSTIEIYYSMGEHKQVPVVFKGKVRTESQHLLCDLQVNPLYVDIYAPSPQYDTITAVYTEPVIYKNVEDTLQFYVPLQKIKGVKMVPDSIEVTACVDLYTTKTIKVPVYCENIPQNKILRTFPMMVEVSFRVSATMYNNITSDDFIVVVDYNTIKSDDQKCRLQLREYPEGVSNVKVNPELADYVIEQE